jgi:hypothetical protein
MNVYHLKGTRKRQKVVLMLLMITGKSLQNQHVNSVGVNILNRPNKTVNRRNNMCYECDKRGKTWKGSDPSCAFMLDEFHTDNWNCATMNKLRNLCYEKGFHKRDDDCNASIGLLSIPENGVVCGYLVMTWYKSRGRVGKAILMCDDEDPHVLTLIEAETIIKSYNTK